MTRSFSFFYFGGLAAALMLVASLPSLIWPLSAADSGRGRVIAQGTAKSDAASDATSDTKQPRAKASKAKNSPGVTPEREAAVMTFVRQNHVELAALLTQLKEHNSTEYQQAIRDLFRASERLATIQERDADRYELELKLWQIQSRIDLLSARIKMSPSDELRTELKGAIREQHSLRRSLLKLERDRTQERLAKLEEQLKAAANVSDESIDRHVKSLVGGSEKNPKAPVKDDIKGKGKSAK